MNRTRTLTLDNETVNVPTLVVSLIGRLVFIVLAFVLLVAALPMITFGQGLTLLLAYICFGASKTFKVSFRD